MARLMDLGDDESFFEASEWSWGPAAQLLARSGGLSLADQVALVESGFAEVEPRQARAFARHLRQEVLPQLGPLDWIDLAGERQSEADAISLQRVLSAKRPAAGRPFLEELAAFCERCAGFVVS